MFDFDTYFEDLIKSHSITEIHCVHSTPPCVAKFRINSTFPNRQDELLAALSKNGL
jgi:hypothetical protein